MTKALPLCVLSVCKRSSQTSLQRHVDSWGYMHGLGVRPEFKSLLQHTTARPWARLLTSLSFSSPVRKIGEASAPPYYCKEQRTNVCKGPTRNKLWGVAQLPREGVLFPPSFHVSLKKPRRTSNWHLTNGSQSQGHHSSLATLFCVPSSVAD